jgi:hypothetical protein
MLPSMVKEHKRVKRNTTVGRKTFELYSSKARNRNNVSNSIISMPSMNNRSISPNSPKLNNGKVREKKKTPLVSNEYQMSFNPMEDTEGLISKNFEHLEACEPSAIEPKKKKRKQYTNVFKSSNSDYRQIEPSIVNG